MSTRPGWYPEPGQPGMLRYWDGQAWTDQRQPAQAPPQAAPPPAPAPAPDFGHRQDLGGRQASGAWFVKPIVFILVPAIVGLVGLFLDWVSAPGFDLSRTGIDTDDGKLSLGLIIAGVVALLLVKFRVTTAIIQTLIGLAIAVTGVIDIVDVNDSPFDVGVGLYITTAAGVLWAIAGLLTLTCRRPGRR